MRRLQPGYWILVDKKVLPAESGLKWAKWFEETKDRRIALTKIKDKYIVSTVFLGVDMNFGSGEPLLFETMVFPKESGDDLDGERYSTYEEAEKGHQKMVEKWKNHV